jgi:type II restriction/modification system DNA methylase subunit YeeA
MNHTQLKRFAQNTRRKLISQISTRLDYVLHQDDPYLRSHQKEKKIIEGLLKRKGEVLLLEETAYIWFNRFTALRFMDNKGYNSVSIVSPEEGSSQPRVLADCKEGRIPTEISSVKDVVMGYLGGTVSVVDSDREAYKTILLAWCNYRGKAMPYLFEPIDDWAALLLPQDLLSVESVITDIQKNILPEDCKDVEIIGWLYQYYISEKKDEVFAGLKKKKKITPENIPAATQLFTPEWIVRYMVENSLGRLWLNNHPESGLRDEMKYYVEADKEKDILKIEDPEEIKMIDPSCGSGHILVYAFDLLYKIYEEEGFGPQDIAAEIIGNNLFGVDIDDRAAALASFALVMKACEVDRSFLEKDILPHIISSQNIEVDPKALELTLSRELTESFQYLKQAKNLGSLIPVKPEVVQEIGDLKEKLVKLSSSQMFWEYDKGEVLKGLMQLEYLSPKYHCVVTNPPYMGSKGMNESLGDFVKKIYPDSKSDLFAVFMEKGFELSISKGYMGMINQQSWMFLSSFEKLRKKLIENQTIVCMAHLGPRAFDSISGEVVQTTSFIIKNKYEDIEGQFQRLIDGKSEAEKETLFTDRKCYHSAKASDFSKIPGSPIAYWVKNPLVFENTLFSDNHSSGGRLKTHGNNKYIRYFWELTEKNILENEWVFIDNGGEYRKWYGNISEVVDYSEDAFLWYKQKGGLTKKGSFDATGICWGMITTGKIGFRIKKKNTEFSSASPTIFPYDSNSILFLNSAACTYYLNIINPTLNTSVGEVLKLPMIKRQLGDKSVFESTTISKSDWDLRETSWEYFRSPLLTNYQSDPIRKVLEENLTDHSWPQALHNSIEHSYKSFTEFWIKQFQTLHQNEEELNRIFIDLYGLQNELTPDVPYNEITILQSELETKALKKGELVFKKEEIITQFISYAVGCIFGRYSLDKDGLILANAGEGLEEYKKQIPIPRFRPDRSGILPITEEDDFTDDLANQFKAFLKASFGDEKYDENLRFVEEAIGKDIRTFFSKSFYKDHIQRYKTRPIYWMISSPSGSFRALIYLHRYTRDTISLFLNDYLRPYQKKLAAKKNMLEQVLVSGDSSNSDKTRAQKQLDKLGKVRVELEEWERDVVYPLATQRVELDLDDGVKVNYGKLGSVLEVVKGLNG